MLSKKKEISPPLTFSEHHSKSILIRLCITYKSNTIPESSGLTHLSNSNRHISLTFCTCPHYSSILSIYSLSVLPVPCPYSPIISIIFLELSHHRSFLFISPDSLSSSSSVSIGELGLRAFSQIIIYPAPLSPFTIPILHPHH